MSLGSTAQNLTKMERKLRVIVDRKTWPGPGIRPLFPKAFAHGQSVHTLNVPAMLLMIGYLTTPPSTTGLSLSEFWAWVRYLAAVSPDSGMALTRSFADLDPHQKTILSDDFGMGVPLLWLTDKLALDQVVDGRYFMQKLAASVGATQKRTAKRGPNKTPDFVARDDKGRWHVIECKGTQSGREYSATQLGSKGPPAVGGVAQKCSIIFPSGHTGQRLVCGLSIAVEGGEGSVLKIVDPEPDEPFEVRDNDLGFALDAANRGVMSKALRMAGFEITAETIASPMGASPDALRPSTQAADSIRMRSLNERDQRSREELLGSFGQHKLFEGKFRGREVTVELPRPIIVDGGVVRKVIIRQGVNSAALEEIRNRPPIAEVEVDSVGEWADLAGRSSVTSDGVTAIMQIGSIFRSEIILV